MNTSDRCLEPSFLNQKLIKETFMKNDNLTDASKAQF